MSALPLVPERTLTPIISKLFTAMIRRAESVLTRYLNDLYVHDRNQLHRIIEEGFEGEFIWILREGGTHLWVDTCYDMHDEHAYYKALRTQVDGKGFSDIAGFFIGDTRTGKLKEVDGVACLDKARIWQRRGSPLTIV